ncbi:ABC transporter ATP-binding protein [Streptomyces sp. NPDC054904]|uniref:ABC transporter ATP-binding protein n=1 Tax=unclassified Streptomyces TaxID=2593676 RepID=UPI002481F049|nr:MULTISPECIES: ABC transporter ATP-binding protein [unclassified Streptomyces]MDA5284137.1 ABC transporter ATP-binding protein [Streptomyces sp. Isolate_45]MDX2394503.1 ABC transporter ATP-binding protein [Streptomyces sp. DK15]
MITLDRLTKRYGDKTAVSDLSFEINPGKVTGFLGPNGAGKSTTMRMIVGLDSPTTGRALIDGKPYGALRHPLREVGALLDARAGHPGRSAYHHLLGMARSNGIPASRVNQVLETVGLTEVAKKRIGSFSLGMGQRLGIAAALLGDPKVLLFDEPVNGLDPDGVRWVRELMRSLAAEGRTVFVSSHLMSEMQETADHLVVIGRGKVIADAPIEEVIAGSSLNAVKVRTTQPDVLRRELVRFGMSVEPEDGARYGELIVVGGSLEQIGDLAFANQVPVHELSPRKASLEQAYMELTASSVEYTTPAVSLAADAQKV